MIIGIKDATKLIGITIIACCVVFVCAIFLNFNIDIAAMKDEITTASGAAMYDAIVSTGKVVAAVSGGCLAATSAAMLLFYVKNYIDTHGKELGILKAIGYSNINIAKHFWTFGLSVFLGCAFGYALAFLYLPTFYELQNADRLFPEIRARFHPILAFLLVCLPAIIFAILAVLYAYLRLKSPALDLLKERREYKTKSSGRESPDIPFLQNLSRSTVRGRKSLVFFIAFSAFCFSAMLQMSTSMTHLSSKEMAAMMLAIGLILAFVTLLLSLSSVVKGNAKTIAMMRVFGYDHGACAKATLGGYRPFAYLGFALGTGYQYVLLKTMTAVVFADVAGLPEYGFDWKACAATLGLFAVAYEAAIRGYARGIRRVAVKGVMGE